jgi:hypothetical protein
MIGRTAVALVFLLAAWGVAAQQNRTADSTAKKSKDDSTQKPHTEGARELFYLAVAPKDKLPPIPRTSAPVAKKAATGTTAPTPPPDSAPAAAPAVHLGLRYNLLLVDDRNQGVAVDSEHVFRKGDHVAIEIEANRSGYLYVLARQSSGSWQALLPSPEMSDESNIIDPGRKIRVPGAYTFEVQDPPGSEHLVLVFSRDPQDFYELYQGIKRQNSAPTPAPAAAPTAVPTPSPAPESQASGGAELADASRVDSAVARMRQQFGTRDIVIRKVSQPLSAGEPTGSVYVVNSSAKPASSVVTEIELKHR